MIEVPRFTTEAIAVLGLGRSGAAAAEALVKSGFRVLAWDDDEKRRAQAGAAGIPVVDLHGHDFADTGTLVLSPGIPHTHPRPHPVAAQASAAGCEILCDIELLARACPEARFVGVTGTNGKSTVTALLGHILRHAGRRVEVGGNIGAPALALAPLAREGIYALELSSYQLDLLPSLVFDVAVLLNIGADHLERHGGFDGYVRSKRRIFRGQGKGKTAVIGVDDESCRDIHRELSRRGAEKVIPVASEREVPGGVYTWEGTLHDATRGAPVPVLDLSLAASLPGVHNGGNAAAAYAAARALAVEPQCIAEAILGFQGLPHRQETVAVVGGVAYVNDSKATNAEATARALACYERIHWIAGGRAKEGGIDSLAPLFARVARAYLIGEAEERFAAMLGNAVPWSKCGDLRTAVERAHDGAQAQAEDGGPAPVVLLSPACASFDQWENFEARGDAFREIVARLVRPPTGVPALREDAR